VLEYSNLQNAGVLIGISFAAGLLAGFLLALWSLRRDNLIVAVRHMFWASIKIGTVLLVCGVLLSLLGYWIYRWPYGTLNKYQRAADANYEVLVDTSQLVVLDIQDQIRSLQNRGLLNEPAAAEVSSTATDEKPSDVSPLQDVLVGVANLEGVLNADKASSREEVLNSVAELGTALMKCDRFMHGSGEDVIPYAIYVSLEQKIKESHQKLKGAYDDVVTYLDAYNHYRIDAFWSFDRDTERQARYPEKLEVCTVRF